MEVDEIELADTEFVDDDGDISEIEYAISETIETILYFQKTKSFRKAVALIGVLTQMTQSAVKEARKNAPLGLTDKSILTRMNRMQYAASYAMDKMIQEKDKKLYSRLFKKDEPLWNYMMRCSIVAVDEAMDGNPNGVMLENGELGYIKGEKIVEVEV